MSWNAIIEWLIWSSWEEGSGRERKYSCRCETKGEVVGIVCMLLIGSDGGDTRLWILVLIYGINLINLQIRVCRVLLFKVGVQRLAASALLGTLLEMQMYGLYPSLQNLLGRTNLCFTMLSRWWSREMAFSVVERVLDAQWKALGRGHVLPPNDLDDQVQPICLL